jgi:phage shock protein B
VAELVVFAPFVTACFIVWIVLHYRDRRRQHELMKMQSRTSDSELGALAEKLERRLQALETILDTEVPGWRKTYSGDH